MEKRPTEVALDAALDAILAGDQRSLLEAVRIIEGHPGSEELRRLLTCAIEARESMRAQPSNQARIRHLRMIGVACREQERTWAVRRLEQARRLRQRIFRPVAVAGVSLGLLLPGALALASTAQPGDALYGAKLTVENVQLVLNQDPVEDVELHVRFAERRMEEILRLEEEGGKDASAAAAASNLKAHSTAVQHAVQQGTAPAGLATTLERHTGGLSTLAGKAGCEQKSPPDASCDGIERALASSTAALTQLKESPSGTTGPLAGGQPASSPKAPAAKRRHNRPTSDKPPADKPPAGGEAAAAPAPAPAPAPSDTSAPAESPTPPESPSPDPSASPTPDPSPSPTPSPSPDPSPSPSPDPSPSPGSGSDPADPVPPDEPQPVIESSDAGTGTIEPHRAGDPTPLP